MNEANCSKDTTKIALCSTGEIFIVDTEKLQELVLDSLDKEERQKKAIRNRGLQIPRVAPQPRQRGSPATPEYYKVIKTAALKLTQISLGATSRKVLDYLLSQMNYLNTVYSDSGKIAAEIHVRSCMVRRSIAELSKVDLIKHVPGRYLVNPSIYQRGDEANIDKARFVWRSTVIEKPAKETGKGHLSCV